MARHRALMWNILGYWLAALVFSSQKIIDLALSSMEYLTLKKENFYKN